MEASEITVESSSQTESSNSKVSAGIQMYVSKVLVHPGYDKDTKSNNTALLWLKKPVKYNEDLSPVCLPVPGMVSKLNCSSSAFGDGKNSELVLKCLDLDCN